MAEISAENLAELEKRYTITVYIVSAQIFSAFVLLVVAWVLASEKAEAEQSFLALWLAILFIAAGTFVLRRRLFHWERLKNTTLLKGVPGVIALLQTNAIVLSVFAEIILILGFIIATLNGNFFDMLRASGIALIVFVLNFPRRSIWEKIVSNLENV